MLTKGYKQSESGDILLQNQSKPSINQSRHYEDNHRLLSMHF